MLRARRTSTDLPDAPVFPNVQGGLRDPSNTNRVLRETRGTDGFARVTSHVFRETAAMIMDEAGLSARLVADQLGHSRTSMTQDVYMSRKMVGRQAADALENDVDKQSGHLVHVMCTRDLRGLAPQVL